MGRGLAAEFDINVVVTEASLNSIEVSRQLLRLSRDLDMKSVLIVVNKVEGAGDLTRTTGDLGISAEKIAAIRSDDSAREADRRSISLLDIKPEPAVLKDIRTVHSRLKGLLEDRRSGDVSIPSNA